MARKCNGQFTKKQAKRDPNRIRKHFVVSGGVVTPLPKVELPKCPLCKTDLSIGGNDNVTVVLFNGIPTTVHKECPIWANSLK